MQLKINWVNILRREFSSNVGSPHHPTHLNCKQGVLWKTRFEFKTSEREKNFIIG